MTTMPLNNVAGTVIGQDDGTYLVSMTAVEKFLVNWTVTGDAFQDLSGFQINGRAVVANQSDATFSTPPSQVAESASAITLTNSNVDGNMFTTYFDATALLAGSTASPTIGNPVWYFFSITTNDQASTSPQVRPIIRGQIRILYSPFV